MPFVDSLSSVAVRELDSWSRLALNIAYGGYIGCTAPLEHLAVMNLLRGISMLTCTEASRGRTRLALPAPEVVAASPAHPAREISFDASFFAYPAGEVSLNDALPIDIPGFREVTCFVSPLLQDLTSKICLRLSSCNAPLNPRTRPREIALLSTPASAVTPADLAGMHYNKGSLKVERRSSFLWLNLSTSSKLKISLCTNDVLPRNWQRKLAITTPDVGASSPAHSAEKLEVIEALPVPEVEAISVALPAEKTDLVEATRIDDMALRDKNNSGDTMSVSETIASKFVSNKNENEMNNHEQQLSEANFVSGKKKVRNTFKLGSRKQGLNFKWSPQSVTGTLQIDVSQFFMHQSYY